MDCFIKCDRCNSTNVVAQKLPAAMPLFDYRCECGYPSAVNDVVSDVVVQNHYTAIYRKAFNPPITDAELTKNIIHAARVQIANAMKPYHNQ